jgi:hypothetical protein
MKMLGGEGRPGPPPIDRPEGWEDVLPRFKYDPGENNYVPVDEEKHNPTTTLGNMGLRCAS